MPGKALDHTTWQYKAVGCLYEAREFQGLVVLISALGLWKETQRVFIPTRSPAVPPKIDKDGILWATVVKDGEARWTPLGEVEKIRDAYRRLAEHLRFSQQEADAMLAALRAWIFTDERELKEDQLP